MLIVLAELLVPFLAGLYGGTRIVLPFRQFMGITLALGAFALLISTARLSDRARLDHWYEMTVWFEGRMLMHGLAAFAVGFVVSGVITYVRMTRKPRRGHH